MDSQPFHDTFEYMDHGKAAEALRGCFDNFITVHLLRMSQINEYEFRFKDIDKLYQKARDVFDHFLAFMVNSVGMSEEILEETNDVEILLQQIISQLDEVAGLYFGRMDLTSPATRRPKKWIIRKYDHEQRDW